ncbi:olfactory receptor 5V1-like [Bombina bombina]|uniref:olfactory receptor 5V1-like n=1 Tax=Bombina bombina TaxID=8345 RepID=UPI00235B2F40|nr:olfactory receptor 5V1-like [Bombina bombina]
MMSNNSTISGFFILRLSDIYEWQVALGFILLIIYMEAVLSNIAILWVTLCDSHLKTPMYFFLGNLAFLDIGYISVTIPKMLVTLLTNNDYISYFGCLNQLYFYVFLEGTEAFLLTVMAYDRYVAICSPLHYKCIMNGNMCILLAFLSWISGSLNASIHTALTFCLPFCNSHKINHFFCDIPPLLRLSCIETSVNELVLFTVGGVWVGLSPFLFIIISYSFILNSITKINSSDGRQKTFSTCSSHVTVVALFFGSSLFTYIQPNYNNSSIENRVVSVIYSIVTPALNPVIYSLRSNNVKQALKKWATTPTFYYYLDTCHFHVLVYPVSEHLLSSSSPHWKRTLGQWPPRYFEFYTPDVEAYRDMQAHTMYSSTLTTIKYYTSMTSYVDLTFIHLSMELGKLPDPLCAVIILSYKDTPSGHMT